MLKKTFKILSAFLILFIALLGYAYFIEPNTLKIENQTIKLNCLKKDLPDRFVQISDLHFTRETKETRISQIYEAIKSQNPAAVFVTGDLVSDDTGMEKAVELIGKISASYKTFVIFGNWDYWALDYGVGELKTRLEAVGAKVLINSSEKIVSGNETLSILGVKDPYTSGELKGDLEKAEKNLDEGDKNCRILLAHSPNIIKEAADKNIDLVLAGHTHGGQVYIPFLTKYIIPAKRPAGKGFIKGLYTIGNTQMYINRGIGMSVLPFRFLVPPEVTVIKLEKQ
ncbi:MAG: metallophosphoesterase [bacterium]|nr:metallophosphoesterase [bacterium]